jgi:hypothetical protein
MTCAAEDSYGDVYPVTAGDYYGVAYQQRIADIEDLALDRCYAESGGDSSCFLLSCTPVYGSVF